MQNIKSLKVPVFVTKEDGLFVATCKIFNIKVSGKTEFETKLNFVSALNDIIQDLFEHMILKKESQAQRNEEESFSMGV